MRKAQACDLGAIEHHLKRSFATTMFLRSNFLNYGIDGASRYCMDVFFDGEAGIEGGLCAITRSGYLLAHVDPSQHRLWVEFAHALKGREVLGMTGDQEQISALFNALGAENAGFKIDDVQRLYAVSLDRVPVFDGVELRAPEPDMIEQLSHWRLASNIEALGERETVSALAEARAQINLLQTEDRLRVLLSNGEVVAMTAFNATLPDCVQIGGVFTPPAERSKGYARRAVALHLAEARRNGVEKAVLFAANLAACRAYEAIGFEQVGHNRVALFSNPFKVDA